MHTNKHMLHVLYKLGEVHDREDAAELPCVKCATSTTHRVWLWDSELGDVAPEIALCADDHDTRAELRKVLVV